MFLSFTDTGIEFALDRAACYQERLQRSSQLEVYYFLSVWITQKVKTKHCWV